MVSILLRAATIRAVDRAGAFWDVDVFEVTSESDAAGTQLMYRVNRQDAQPTSDGAFEILGTGERLWPAASRPAAVALV